MFFRDTANGLLSWALASVLVVGLMFSGATSLLSGATHVAASASSGAAQGAMTQMQRTTSVDTLLRPNTPNPDASPDEARHEIYRALAAAPDGNMSAEDRTYTAQLIAANTGVSQDEAGKRLDAALAEEKAATDKAKQTADATRKATAAFLLYSFISMLIGAFIASAAAAFGGRERDAV